MKAPEDRGKNRKDELPIDETQRLIASDKVEGTHVFDPQGHELGTVLNFMVDKYTGKVAYAVLSFGGWLGLLLAFRGKAARQAWFGARMAPFMIARGATVLKVGQIM